MHFIKSNLFKTRLTSLALLTWLIPQAGLAAITPLSSLLEGADLSIRSTNKLVGTDEWNSRKELTETNYEAAGAIIVNMASGKVGGKGVAVGFELGGVGVFEIAERNSNDIYGDGYVSREECYADLNNKGRLTCTGRAGFSKITQASMVAEFGRRKKRSATVQFGMGYFEGGAITSYDKDDGFIPRTYTGMSLQGRWNDLEYSGAFINGLMSDYETSIQPLTLYESKALPDGPRVRMDYIASVNAIFKRGSSTYQLDYAVTDGYNTTYRGLWDHTLKLGNRSEVEFNAAFGINQFSGKNWDEAVAKGIRNKEEDNASLTSLRMIYQYDNLRLSLAHSIVGGDTKYEKYMGGVSQRYTQYAKGFGDSFLSADTKSYQFKAHYNLSAVDIPVIRDMTLIYGYSHASKEQEIDGVNEVGFANEHAIEFAYKQPSGYFAGGVITGGFGKLEGDRAWGKIAENEPDEKGDVTKFELEVQFPIY